MVCQKFAKFPHPKKWERFLTYSRRIKHLVINSGGETNLPINEWTPLDDSVFQTVALSRPVINFLPNVRQIEVYHSEPHHDSILQQSIMFLHEGLQCLRIVLLDADNPEVLEAIVCNIVNKVSQLKDLQLLINGSASNIERPVNYLLLSLEHLRKLMLSSCTLTSSALLAASHLPVLETLSIDKSTYPYGGNVADISFASSSVVDGFPRLVTLEIQGDISELSTLFSRSNTTFANLRHLELDVLHHDNREGLRSCLHILKSACPLLTSLQFIRDINLYMNFAFLERAGAANPIESEDLTALQDFRRLQKFTLACDRPVRMSDRELVALISACPNIKALDLNCDPIVMSSPTLTIGVLAQLSSRFPALEDLGLYVNPRKEDLPEIAAPFRKLRKVCFGCSPEPMTNRTAFFLGKLLPLECVVDTAARRYTIAADGYAALELDLLCNRREAWASMKELLPTLIQARADCEERAALKAQILELSVQNRELRASEEAFRIENAGLRAQLRASGTSDRE